MGTMKRPKWLKKWSEVNRPDLDITGGLRKGGYGNQVVDATTEKGEHLTKEEVSNLSDEEMQTIFGEVTRNVPGKGVVTLDPVTGEEITKEHSLVVYKTEDNPVVEKELTSKDCGEGMRWNYFTKSCVPTKEEIEEEIEPVTPSGKGKVNLRRRYLRGKGSKSQR